MGPGRRRGLAAKRLARALHGTVPVIAGAALTAPIAYRWKTQFNENAGLPAFASACPSSTTTRSSAGRARTGSARSRRSSSTSRGRIRASRRAPSSARVEAEAGARVVERIGTRGETRLERVFSLVLLGDLVSLYIAVLAGIDPVDIAPIDRLKRSLAQR